MPRARIPGVPQGLQQGPAVTLHLARAGEIDLGTLSLLLLSPTQGTEVYLVFKFCRNRAMGGVTSTQMFSPGFHIYH